MQLPPHKLSPHDVVALRPNSQPPGAGGAPLVGGLVYRVRETAIVIAVDEAPEEGLEQPLRVEKLANEVCEGVWWSAFGGVCRCVHAQIACVYVTLLLSTSAGDVQAAAQHAPAAVRPGLPQPAAAAPRAAPGGRRVRPAGTAVLGGNSRLETREFAAGREPAEGRVVGAEGARRGFDTRATGWVACLGSFG